MGAERASGQRRWRLQRMGRPTDADAKCRWVLGAVRPGLAPRSSLQIRDPRGRPSGPTAQGGPAGGACRATAQHGVDYCRAVATSMAGWAMDDRALGAQRSSSAHLDLRNPSRLVAPQLGREWAVFDLSRAR